MSKEKEPPEEVWIYKDEDGFLYADDCKHPFVESVQYTRVVAKPKKLPVPVKKGIDVPMFVDADVWNDFCKHRGKSLTTLAAERIIKKLTKWHNVGYDVNDILNTSIMNGWKGVFEPDKKPNKEARNGTDAIKNELKEYLQSNNAGVDARTDEWPF